MTITDSPITRGGLSHFRGCSGLIYLSLDRTRVERLEPLEHLTMIRVLSLDDTPIDDAGLAPVAGFRNLIRLHLSGTRISDAALASRICPRLTFSP